MGDMHATALAAESGGVHIRRVESRAVDDQLVVDADINYEFTAAILDALKNGVALTLQVEMEVQRIRHWLWNASLSRHSIRRRLQYHALSRQYLVTDLGSGRQRSYRTLLGALRALGQLRGTPLVERSRLIAGEEHTGLLRAWLDLEQLPVPLRLTAYLSPQWQIRSEEYRWPVQP